MGNVIAVKIMRYSAHWPPYIVILGLIIYYISSSASPVVLTHNLHSHRRIIPIVVIVLIIFITIIIFIIVLRLELALTLSLLFSSLYNNVTLLNMEPLSFSSQLQNF